MFAWLLLMTNCSQSDIVFLYPENEFYYFKNSVAKYKYLFRYRRTSTHLSYLYLF